jgi:hypothetical protein
MVSQRDLENVVKQINVSYERLVNKIDSLQKEVTALKPLTQNQEKVKK